MERGVYSILARDLGTADFLAGPPALFSRSSNNRQPTHAPKPAKRVSKRGA